MDCVERIVHKMGHLNGMCGNCFLLTCFLGEFFFHITMKLEKSNAEGPSVR